MDNARGYELHLNQLENIYRENRVKKLDGFNRLNDRILRTRNVNRNAVRVSEQKSKKSENTKMLENLKKVNVRKNRFPDYNYQLPTGICRFNYETKAQNSM